MDDYATGVLEDIYREEISFKFRPGITNVNHIKIATNQTPFFAYDYLNFQIKEFSFDHPDFLQDDYQIYFSQVAKIARITMKNLMNHHKRSDHFHIGSANYKMAKILRQLFKNNRLREIELPLVGQFHLYTPNNGSRKAPRIHFFVGPISALYITLYDPYHEIYPVPHLISENTNAA